MKEIIDLSLGRLLLAYVFVLLVLFILRKKKNSVQREIIFSSLRMTIQLVITGQVLVYLFKDPRPIYTILFLILMEVFAIHNTFKRVKHPLSKDLKKVISLSMILGTTSCLLYFLLVVVQISPWYDPQYFIPIAGMLIGNSMTGISLGINQLMEGMSTQKNYIEGALMLGASPKMASKKLVDTAFDSAILPIINSTVGMGIVFLPGMMTGQILSGVSPALAIRYQIAVMLGILGSVALTSILCLHLGYQTFFNKEDQINF